MRNRSTLLPAVAALAAATLLVAGQAEASTTRFSSLASFTAATSGLATVGFDHSVPTEDGIVIQGSSFSFGGVDFAMTQGNFISTRGPKELNDDRTIFRAGLQFGSDFLDFQDGRTGLTITLPRAVKAFGFDFINLFGDDDHWTIDIGSDSFSAESGDTAQFFGLVSETAFTTVTIHESTGFGTLDSLRFDAGAVPEPASLALFGFALAGLGIARRGKAA